jgi:hypothetical protein
LCFLILKTFSKDKNDYMTDNLRGKRKRKTQRVFILVHSLTRVVQSSSHSRVYPLKSLKLKLLRHSIQDFLLRHKFNTSFIKILLIKRLLLLKVLLTKRLLLQSKFTEIVVCLLHLRLLQSGKLTIKCIELLLKNLDNILRYKFIRI